MLMGGKRFFVLSAILVAFLSTVIFAAYSSPEKMLAGVQAAEMSRAEKQRAQINTQVAIWQKNTWVGSGYKATAVENYDPGTGNVYFQILAQSGLLGAGFFLFFILATLLSTYRIFNEVSPSHYWHRVLIAGALGSQIAFHVAGLYWSTMAEALTANLFAMILASISYLSEHYGRGLVPDDYSL
jgi:O-antigen ligase